MQLTFKPLSHAIFTLFIYMQASSVYYFNTTQTVKLTVEYYSSHLETVIEQNQLFHSTKSYRS